MDELNSGQPIQAPIKSLFGDIECNLGVISKFGPARAKMRFGI
jgi:hypothetical protein